MKILVVGGGGREHALAWKLASSPRASTVFVAPGNAGTAGEAGVTNVSIEAMDFDGLRDFALREQVDITIIGPEAPLVAGIVDHFREAGLRCFGPDRQGAQLEGSKEFTKQFLKRHKIPTAEYASFTDATQAIEYVRHRGAPIVVKADGLAAGKGVILAATVTEAEQAINDMLTGNTFGEAGHRVVIEEFLRGEEASFICIVGGDSALPMASSQDHKARDEGDLGPNTGGMGAYSPAPVVDADMHRTIMREVILPTVKGLQEDGIDYRGFLYAGVMISEDNIPKVLEFNCRFGDPETQPILMRLESDLLELCEAALDGTLKDVRADWDPRAALGVVMAAGGYPFDYRSGDPISGLDHVNDVTTHVFHAGTCLDHQQVVTCGGRVLCVTALGDTVSEAHKRAYTACESIYFDNAYYRRDIGHRAITREPDTDSDAT
ncbi:MAG: phosphoribosylamine--glycine ligase [marine bacterium B5-7]|nr:MAG: phosphoribosylamine--glycine ligase [marine bacterium B5-7]